MKTRLKSLRINSLRALTPEDQGDTALEICDFGDFNVVVAPNGTGKSTIIEAIFLAVSGTPRRQDSPSSLQHRSIKPSPSPGLNAKFAYVDHNETSSLRDAPWSLDQCETFTPPKYLYRGKRNRGPDEISELLRLTHFLPQNYGERFSDGGNQEFRHRLILRALGMDRTKGLIKRSQGTGSIGRAVARLSEPVNLMNLLNKIDGLRKDFEQIESALLSLQNRAEETGAKSKEQVQSDLAEICDLLVDAGLSPERGAHIVRLQSWVEEETSRYRQALDLVEANAGKAESFEDQLARATGLLEILLSDLSRAIQSQRSQSASASQIFSTKWEALKEQLTSEASEQERLITISLDKAANLIELSEKDARDVGDRDYLDRVLQTKREELEILTGKLSETHDSRSTMANALKAILREYNFEDGSCPVCSTSFDSDSLRRKLESSIAAFGDLERLQNQAKIEALEKKISETEEQILKLGRLESTKEEQVSHFSNLNSRKERINSWLIQLNSFSLSEDVNDPCFELPNWILNPDWRDADGQHEQNRSIQSSIRDLHEGIQHGLELSRLDATAKKIHSVLSKKELTSMGIIESLLEDFQNSTLKRAGPLGSAIKDSHSVVQRVVKIGSEIQQATRKLARLTQPNTGNSNNYQRAFSALNAANRDLKIIKRQHDEWYRAQEMMEKRQQLRLKIEEINDSVGLSLESNDFSFATLKAISDALDTHASQIREKCHILKSRKEYVFNFMSDANKELSHIADTYLNSVSATMENYLKVLTHNSAWDLSNRVSRDKIEQKSGSFPVEQTLSAGETTALSLAFLLAFHTRHRWSTWDALVLDDPFQASDAIRISSLLDILRNMCLDLDTQIILTTHDMDQAHWAIRRANNVHLDWRLIKLERTESGTMARAFSKDGEL